MRQVASAQVEVRHLIRVVQPNARRSFAWDRRELWNRFSGSTAGLGAASNISHEVLTPGRLRGVTLGCL